MTKILVLGLVLTLCLGVIGVGYAIWGNDVYVDGTVTTGDVQNQWAWCQSFDNDSDPGWGTVSCNITTGSSGNVDDTLIITINNAYPGYEATINAGLINVGSVPSVTDGTIATIPSELTVEMSGAAFEDGTVLYPCADCAQVGTIVVGVTEDAEPLTDYSFSITVDPHVYAP